MKNPKIELKKVKIFRGHDGVGLDCDLYVDGKKVAHVFDSAHGGGNEYDEYGNTTEEIRENRKILADLEEYSKTQTYICEFNGEIMTKNLDIILDEILQAAEKEKLAKSIVKKFATHIIVGIPGGDSVTEYKYGKPAILLSTISTVKIQADINTIKANLKDGQVILNTNLQALGIVI
jgi:hypothetical protein